MRVISSTNTVEIPNHPHPNPLPEYREREKDFAGRREMGKELDAVPFTDPDFRSFRILAFLVLRRSPGAPGL